MGLKRKWMERKMEVEEEKEKERYMVGRKI
jgi:hypothetical protein